MEGTSVKENFCCCPACGKENEKDNHFCLNCGFDLLNTNSNTNQVVAPQTLVPENIEQNQVQVKKDVFYCPECGKENEQDNHFCLNCGFNLFNFKNSNQSAGINQVIQEENKYKTISCILGIFSVIITVFLPTLFIVFIVLAILSLTKKQYKSYGITVLIGYGLIIIVFIVLFIMLISAFSTIYS